MVMFCALAGCNIHNSHGDDMWTIITCIIFVLIANLPDWEQYDRQGAINDYGLEVE